MTVTCSTPFPRDELCPLTCSGRDTWGSFSLTLIDSLDTLIVSDWVMLIVSDWVMLIVSDWVMLIVSDWVMECVNSN